MAFIAAVNLSVPYEDYPGFFLKCFEQGTTTPLSMATDSTGGTLLAKAEISSGGTVPIGFIKTAGDVIFQPYLDAAYDAWLFPTAAEADANDTSNAVQIADNIDLSAARENRQTIDLTVTIGTSSFPAASTGFTIETNSYDSNHAIGSGGEFQFTGTTTVGKAGNVPDADGKFYDADGKQFTLLSDAVLFVQFGVLFDDATDNSFAMQAAVDSGAKRVFGSDGVCRFATGITPPNKVYVDGISRRATIYRYSGTGLAFKFGTSDTVLNIGCGISHCTILLNDKASTGIKLNATNAAQVVDVYIEGLAAPFDSTRTNIGVHIDGANVSSFFNYLESVDCNHIHESHRIATTGTTHATGQTWINCSVFGDVATDATSIGWNFNNGTTDPEGQGSSILGGNVERCGTGIKVGSFAGAIAMLGVRFEASSNTIDVHFVGTSSETSTVIGCANLRNVTIDTPSTSLVVIMEDDGRWGRETTGQTFRDRLTLDAGAGNVFNVLTPEDNTGTGFVRYQAGAGSANFGGGLSLYAHAHPSKPGDVAAGLSSSSGGSFRVNSSGIDDGTTFFKIDQSAVARDTRMLVWDVDNNTLERVTVGIADSGGAGFKLLRIPN